MHTIIHIGAGQASELPQWLETGAKQIVLVEPNPELAEQLRQRTARHTQVTVVEAAITTNPANNQLHEYNLPEASSLHAPTGLKTLFPGLKAIATHTVATLDPEQLLADHGPESGQPAMLVLQTPGEENAIIQALISCGKLNQFGDLHLAANPEPYYQGSISAEKTLQALAEHGYDITQENWQDPDWPIWHLTRDLQKDIIEALKKELEEKKQALETLAKQKADAEQQAGQEVNNLNQQLTQKEKQLSDLARKNENLSHAEEAFSAKAQQLAERNTTLEESQKQLEQIRAELEEKKKQFDSRKQQAKRLQQELGQEKQAHQATVKAHDQLKRNLSAAEAELAKHKEDSQQLLRQAEEQRIQLNQTRQALEQEKAEHNATKEAQAQQNQQLQNLEQKQAELQQQLSSEASNQNALKTLQERMEYLFDQNTLQLEQATNALSQHVSQTAESTARELEAGIALQQLAPRGTNNHGGLPKSAALELASLLRTKNYDLIIEMGSGSTTQFIAQTLKSAGREHAAPNSNQKELEHYVEASEDDLPKRVLSFDHNRSRQKELSDKLGNAGLANFVSVQFAPLVPYQSNGKEQLFYDCGTRLQQVANLFHNCQARILVVVNIDATETGPEPGAALPAVLQYLSAHQIDVITHAPTLQQLASQWEKLLSARGLDHSLPKPLGTSQVQHLTVNP